MAQKNDQSFGKIFPTTLNGVNGGAADADAIQFPNHPAIQYVVNVISGTPTILVELSNTGDFSGEEVEAADLASGAVTAGKLYTGLIVLPPEWNYARITVDGAMTGGAYFVGKGQRVSPETDDGDVVDAGTIVSILA